MYLETLFYTGIIVSIVVLGIFSFIVKDISFIKEYPLDFFIELIFVSVVPALLMVFVFARTRNMSPNTTLVWFLSVLIKLMIFHILFQLSGLYTYAFGKR
jgi:uncharacterized membrane protein YvlD (DUF360 family)